MSVQRGRNRYRVQGTSVSGRAYQDFVFADTEAEARAGALRERGFRSVTCMTLMPPNNPTDKETTTCPTPTTSH